MEFLSKKERSILYFLLGVMTTVSVLCIYMIFTKKCPSCPRCDPCPMCPDCKPVIPDCPSCPSPCSNLCPDSPAKLSALPESPEQKCQLNDPDEQLQNQIQTKIQQLQQLQTKLRTKQSQQVRSSQNCSSQKSYVYPPQYLDNIRRANETANIQLPATLPPQRYNDPNAISKYSIPETFDDEGYMFTRND